MIDIGKNREIGPDPLGKFPSHFLLDVEILLAPDHLHRGLELIKVGLEIVSARQRTTRSTCA